MGSSKYFVWGEGVWRELDLSSGRVSGWRRRVNFVFVRRGRLEVARRRAVLRALQDLAAGQPGAAADGPRLSYRSKTAALAAPAPTAAVAPVAPPAAPSLACAQHHCCAHYNGCALNFPKALPIPTIPNPFTYPKREAAVQCSTFDASTSTERAHAITISVNNRAYKNGLNHPSSGDDFVSTPMRKKLDENNRTEVSKLLGKHNTVKAKTETQEKVVNTSSDASKSDSRRKVKAKTRSVRDNTNADARANNVQKSAVDESGTALGAVRKELIIPEGDVAALRGFVARTRASALARFDADDSYKRALFYAINPLVELERSARLERSLTERHAAALPHFAARLGLTPTSDVERSTATPSPSRGQRPRPTVRYREESASSDNNKENKETRPSSSKSRTKPNIIADKAEVALEGRITRSSGAGLGNTDTNNKKKDIEPTRTTRASGAKLGVFENVNTEESRSNKVESREYKEYSQNCELSKGTRTSGSRLGMTERGNKEPKEKREEYRDKNEQSKASDAAGVTRAGFGGARTGLSERDKKATVVVDDDSEDEPIVKRRQQPLVPGHTISKRASSSTTKEYSNLEDHAIVAWLSSGSRASQVNGNKLWKELQGQYFRITGNTRSWHSIRNRYLRYILPALGALGLPPATASRLRAAAAAGTANNRKKSAARKRRASILKQEVVVGAASRRLQPAQASGDEDTAPTAGRDTQNGGTFPRRTLRPHGSLGPDRSGRSGRSGRLPRYSEVTRRFAAAHRRSSSSDPTSPTSPTSPTPPTRPTHHTSPTRAHTTRKLFNPDYKL